MITLNDWANTTKEGGYLFAHDYGQVIQFEASKVYAVASQKSGVALSGACGNFYLDNIYLTANEAIEQCIKFYQEKLKQQEG